MLCSHVYKKLACFCGGKRQGGKNKALPSLIHPQVLFIIILPLSAPLFLFSSVSSSSLVILTWPFTVYPLYFPYLHYPVFPSFSYNPFLRPFHSSLSILSPFCHHPFYFIFPSPSVLIWLAHFPPAFPYPVNTPCFRSFPTHSAFSLSC